MEKDDSVLVRVVCLTHSRVYNEHFVAENFYHQTFFMPFLYAWRKLCDVCLYMKGL